MLLILLGLVLALLPIVLTSAFPHLVVVSIYAGLIPWLALGWAVFIIVILLRRKRIAEWRQNRKLKKEVKKDADFIGSFYFLPTLYLEFLSFLLD